MKTLFLLLSLSLSFSALAQKRLSDIRIKKVPGQIGTVSCGDQDDWHRKCQKPLSYKDVVVVSVEEEKTYEYQGMPQITKQKEFTFPIENFSKADIEVFRSTDYQKKKKIFEELFDIDGKNVKEFKEKCDEDSKSSLGQLQEFFSAN